MFERLIAGILHFFETGEILVDEWETIAIAEILETARLAEKAPGQWIPICS